MLTKVVVHGPGDYEKWLAKAIEGPDLPPVELGKSLYDKLGCAACHSIDGTPKVGPSLKGLWGKNELIADGSSLLVDENYLRESLLQPQAKIVQGYTPSMPTFQGKLKDKQITGLIEFIKSLK
jgi:cytochrome c oxidase subunit 2